MVEPRAEGGLQVKPALVCKIKVQKHSGPYIGSGYPITRNRVITAAHVITDAMPTTDQAYDITLSFGTRAKTVAGPVYIEWDGKDKGVDVAVLRCELPDDLQPAHLLLSIPPGTPISWFAKGYTESGERTLGDVPDDYRGTLSKFSNEDSFVALESTSGPIKSEQWEGGSGSVAFDSETAKTALAVITDYQDGKKRDRLIAVPICYLLNAEEIKAGFCRAIDFDSYKDRQDYRGEVTRIVTLQLERMSDECLLTVANKIATLMGADASDVNLQKTARAVVIKDTATRIIDHLDVTEVIGVLVGLQQTLEREDFNKVGTVIDHVLPLNYAPHTIQRLRQQLNQGKLGIVADEVATRTLAEIIMASHDELPALYIDPTKRKTNDIPGQTALDYQEDPESGPDLLPRVRNMLSDMVANYDTVLGLEDMPVPTVESKQFTEAELKQEIKAYADTLQVAIETTRDLYLGRRLYCVLNPPKDETYRSTRLQLLEEIAKQVPNLMFVELIASNKADRREVKTRNFIVARLVRK